ncbi:hypothetical protein EZV62_003656 [Acer yangbiense]|uniref:Rx N-terminal domain-containing protein n=1 Tax=Acer yangbiense TaxID=1000413 RepID=A0A5C7IHW6_9ROSI|nr:hypothetical protein EZV62_003656 [Acer yangbiense]
MADAIVSIVLEQLASIARQQIQQEVTLVWGVNKELKLQIKRAENALTLKKKVCSFFLSPCFCFRQVVLHHDIAVKIKEINESLDDIAKEKDRYNFNMVGSVEQPQKVESISLIDESEIFGRDKEKDILVRLVALFVACFTVLLPWLVLLWLCGFCLFFDLPVRVCHSLLEGFVILLYGERTSPGNISQKHNLGFSGSEEAKNGDDQLDVITHNSEADEQEVLNSESVCAMHHQDASGNNKLLQMLGAFLPNATPMGMSLRAKFFGWNAILDLGKGGEEFD